MPVHAGNQEQGACRADVQKFCKGVAPGDGAIARCLSQHQSEISPGCRDRMAQGRRRAEEFAEACKADAAKVCNQVQPGGGRMLRCLAASKEQLSAPCREKIAQAEKRHPCMAEIERLCKSVQPGEGRVHECLRQHQGELAGACKAALAGSGKDRK
jgi:Golgi apparatus protein 1